MTRIRTSGAIAILFCVVVFLCSIGHVSGLETEPVYEAPDLMLTQGQAKYDLSDGITYNEDEYELSVCDQGEFNINVPGNYTVGYQLTPLALDAIRGSVPEETLVPEETVGPKETTEPKAPGGSKENSVPGEAGGTKETTVSEDAAGAKETTAPKETTGAKETTVPKETTGAKETTVPKETTGAKETTVAKETTGAKETTVAKETTGARETTVPNETTGARETTAPKETTGAKETTVPKETTGSQETTAPDVAAGSGDAAAPAETTKPSGPAGTPGQGEAAAPKKTAAPGTAAAPDGSDGSKEASAPKEISASKGAAGQREDSEQEQAKTPEVPHEAGKAAAGTDTMKIQGGSAPALFKIDALNKDMQEKSAALPMDGGKVLITENVSVLDAVSAPENTPEKASVMGKAPASDKAKEAVSQASENIPELGNSAKPEQTTAPQKAQAQEDAAKPEQTTAPRKPQAQENGLVPAKTSAKQSQPEKASSSQADPARQPISFTRTVVVKDAVQYQNARFDVDALTNLLTGMNFDQTHYSLSVLEDDGFNSSRINEYHIIYRLVNTDNGRKVADLERYVWITAPGVSFDAPDLELSLNQADYDLQEGIDYDSTGYALDTVNPEIVDTSNTGKHRVMFHMTALPENAGVPKAGPLQPEDSESKKTAGPEAAAGPGIFTMGEESFVTTKRSAQRTEGGSEEFPEPPAADGADTYSTKGTLARPVAAIFGRNVKVGEDPVVVIDAPPLIIQEGTAGEHNLLEGVTATDEDGNPVPLLVANRSELDQAAERAASSLQPGKDSSLWETEGTPSEEKPALPGFFSLLALPSSVQNKDSMMKIGELPDLTKDLTEQNEAGAPGNGESSVQSTEIPANLPPGTYNVLLSAAHPVTGETFTMMRSLSVGEEELPLKILDPSQSPYTIDVSKDHTPIFVSPGAGGGDVTVIFTGVGYINPFDLTWINSSGVRYTGNFSCITVMSTTSLTVILADGADVTLKGSPGKDGGSDNKAAQGGGAGIFVQDFGSYIPAYLTISGNGKLTAIGGDAGAGGYAAGRSQGGGGGGGAGAGIGGIGGSGGIGGYPGHPNGGNGSGGVAPDPSHIRILAPNVTRINGSGNSRTPMVRNDGAGSGGGGMPTDPSSWENGFSGGYGGGGGGAGGSATLGSYGGFGLGFGRFADVNKKQGDGGVGGNTALGVRVAVDAEGSDRRLGFATLRNAFMAIKQDAVKDIRKNYTVTLLGDYDYTEPDNIALSELTGLSNQVKIKITGLDAIDRDPSQKKYKMNVPDHNITFPLSQDASASAAFTMENMGLATNASFADLYAGGSKLVMGSGMEFKNDLWAIYAGPLRSAATGIHGDVTVYDGSYNGLYGDAKGGCVLTVEGKEVTAGFVSDWDTVNILSGGKLTLSAGGLMDLCGASQSPGMIRLGSGGKLSLHSMLNLAGGLETTGDGAALEFARQFNAGSQASLILSGTAPVDLTAHPLTMKYSGAGDVPVSGDILIEFKQMSNARTEDYVSGFGKGWEIKANQATGLVYLEKNVVRVDYSAASGKAGDFFGTLGRALDSVKEAQTGGKGGVYTLTLLQDAGFTAEDEAKFQRVYSQLTSTSTIVLTGKDTRNPSAPVRTLTLSADMMLGTGVMSRNNAACEIRDIVISQGGNWNIAANGTRLTLGDGIETAGVPGNYPDVIGGVFERKDVAKDLAFNGNVWLEVRSGTWGNIVGGNWHNWTQTTSQSDPAVSTVTGDAWVDVKGSATAQMICGGSYVNSGTSTYAASRRVGSSTVTFTGKAPDMRVIAGGNGPGKGSMVEDSVTGTAKAVLNNAQVQVVYGSPGLYGRYLSSQGDVELSVKGSASVNRVADFGAVRLTKDSKLTVTGGMVRVSNFRDDASKPAMLLDFQGNANLELQTLGDVYGNNRAGSFRIEGEGNTLTLSRASADVIPLTLDRATPNVRVGNARLELSYPVGTAVRPGDKLLSFDPAKQNADAADYGPEIGSFAVIADKRTGYVFTGSAVTVEETGKKLQFYPSLAKAMDAIGNGTGEYTVTIRKGEYKLTQEDGMALATQGGNARKITYTSQFVTTSDDTLEPGEKVGNTVIRTLIVGEGTTAASPKSDLYLNSRISVVEKIKFKYLQAGCALYVNGHSLVIGPQVEILSDAGYYPIVYGGSKSQPVASTDVTIQSGRYNGIYGGGREAGATVTGNASIKFGGDAELVGVLYGGGEAGDVAGTASVEITGGRALAADAASGAKNTIVGGGKTGNVGGSSVTISGGTANGTIEIAGCDGGNVLGDVNLLIKESADSPPPKAALGNLYGASLRQGDPGAGTAGIVTGSIHIIITNGKDYGTIRGGRSAVTGAGQSSSITFKGGSVKVGNIMDFDFLNLGEPDVSLDKTSLFLTGKLQGEEGCLKFWDGSVLTFQGTSMDPADLVVKNIQTDDTATRSHLHMYKGPGIASPDPVTRPLNITGENTSASGNKLVLGEYGPGGTGEGDKIGKSGDRLLAFKTAEKADAQSYISDLQGLDIVPGTVPGVLELGLSASPKIALSRVSHTTQTGEMTQADRPGVSVTKTLTFEIESFRDEDPTKPGGAVTSAYVDAVWTPDAAWAEGGTIPAGGRELTVKQAAPGSVHWSGTVTMPVTPPINPAPAYYFAHVRDENHQVHTAVLDVHSPVQNGSAVASRDGGGNYTFTVDLQDLKPKDMGNPDIIYNVSGLKQIAWAAGRVLDPAPAGQAEALAPMMTGGGGLKQVVTLDVPSIDSYSWTFTVPAGDLGTDPADMAVYLYAKDAMGNTGMYVIPLNDNRIDVQIPLWAGTAALRGGDFPRLLAPDLYVVNWSEKPVKAELVGAEVPRGQGNPGDGKLLLTNKKSGPWAVNELNLMVKPLDDGPAKDYFATTSVKDINPITNALNLGIMPGRNEANHGTGFTLAALYDQVNIIRTSGWSQCELTYRFSLAPSTEPAPQP